MSPVRAFKLCFSAAIAALLACACADDIGPAPASLLADSAPSSLGASYRLGIGDKLKITVFGEDTLSGPVEVNAAGQVALPLAGDVPAAGKTLSQFRDAVTARLSDGYLKNPKVTVEISNYRPIYVHGEVKNGGEFNYKTGLKLRDAVAMAGGYTYRANQSTIILIRDGVGEVSVPANGTVSLLPGDNIRIPERFF
ncbi:MAG: polysaccharide biosynthesis/export family protein [Deltaproteobacteria bacterium]